MNTQQGIVGNDVQLVTFNCPKHFLNIFDELRMYKRVSRSSMLLNLMEGFVRTERKQLKEDDELNNFIRDVKLRNSELNTPSFNKETSKQYVRWEDSYLDDEKTTNTPINDWRDNMRW